MPRDKISEQMHHPFSHVFIFGIMFLRVTVSLPGRLQAVSKIHIPIYRYLISEERPSDRCDSQETCYQI